MEQPKQQPQQQQQNPFAKVEELLQQQNAMLDRLVRQTTIANRVRDGKLKFLYRDRWFEFSLPEASSDLTQKLMALAGGFKDLHELQNLEQYLKQDAVVVDIGANIGNHTVWFASRPQVAHVIAFEPQRQVFDILNENIRLNELDDKVSAYNKALGSGKFEEAEIAAYTDGSSQADNGQTTFREVKKGAYPVRTLDAYDLKRLDLVKIDVEGMQLEVLQGAQETLKRLRPVLYVEMLAGPQPHTRNLYSREHEMDAPKRLLSDLGYDIRRVTPMDYLAIPR